MQGIALNFKKITTKFVPWAGATIKGFGKRGSTLNSRKLFIEESKKLNPDFLCFTLDQA